MYLGPRGLMPNPIVHCKWMLQAAAEVKAGKIDFKVDKLVCTCRIGKVSFELSKLLTMHTKLFKH
jgi:ribosomal protein L1